MKTLINNFKKIDIHHIINNKKLLYGTSLIVLVLLTVALNLTYSALKSSNSNQAANITVNGMKYSMTINGTSGTVITASNNSITKSNIVFYSLNSKDSKYELIYHVCSDSSCTNYIATPSNVNIEYSSKTTDSISGSITSSGSKSIRIIVDNQSTTTYYIKVDINAGYVYNSLALQNMITTKYNEEDVTIAAIIDGTVSTTFPTTSSYNATVACTSNGGASNATGAASWNGTKWVVNVTGVDTGQTVCNVTFTKFTLLKDYIVGFNNANVSSTLTTPGQAISTSGEMVLTSTADDYGTSYYYRGAVENNYIVFANMCWRIVRVTGNGAIKLVLYNYNSGSYSNPCDSTYDSTSASFARYSGSTYTSAFNSNYTDNSYIGFMYGTTGSSTYAATHTNTNKSTILTNLETWYTSKLSTYSSYLADIIWCNDKSMSTASTYLGYGTNITYYKAYQRMYPVASANPSLICPVDANGGKLSKYTVSDTTNGNGNLTYKIGLLTADEIVFAGAEWATANSTYYLYKNASSTWWWSLSPLDFNSYAHVWNVNSTVNMNFSVVNVVCGLRPSIALVSTTTVTGTGTSSDPYVVTGY